MTFVISGLTRCTATGSHITISGTIGGTSGTIHMLLSDFTTDFNDPDEIRDAFVARVRSAVKEAGATTPAQIQTALVGKTFQI